ncbi:phosphatidylserine decarboxylase family protein [Phanerochaete sordida]|uniref:Phosphatidylserine decarboxylase family protein n=1 Tax=Phanerochaete sordida TaxID=48140 RepID=A0A9P3FXU5_9APHY|nr:phosphatidylserine decarboxylase family protein [Phanerochaete sordida]
MALSSTSDTHSSWRLFRRIGGWLPDNAEIIVRWLDRKISLVEHQDRSNVALHPVIQEFQHFIEGDPVIYMGFHQMFEQIPEGAPYDKDPVGRPQIRDYKLMLKLFDHVLTTAPAFEDNAFVAFPINAVLNWPMGTPAGQAMFTNPRVNSMFKRMFDVWAAFLTCPESRCVLTASDDGWFGPKASEKMPNFAETFVCDPAKEYHGFASWDDFFTRVFRPGVRPVAAPDDDAVITNACESTVYRIASGVKASDTFWLKGAPYSLTHMLADDALAGAFAGGTVYQAFLSATSYHRWHSPVRGTVVRTAAVPGAYYASSPAVVLPNEPDPVAQMLSQAFIACVATRAMVFIQADNPDIGLMCFLAVGMAEVSTCEITVKSGDKLQKGDQLGMFHFGGSTHCLIFRPETKLAFSNEHPIDSNVPLNAAIATVQPP